MYTLDLASTTTTARPQAFVGTVGAAGALPPRGAKRRIATFTSAGQAYYWKNAWQLGEHESLQDLERGEAMVFSDPLSAVRYLLSTDDK